MAQAAAEIIVEHAGPLTDSSAHIEGRALSTWRAESRSFFNLPDAPVVAAGHQAQAWHAGIVAKTLWTDALARQTHATPVHVVVDQDAFDGFFVEWPAMRDGFWQANGNRFSNINKNITAVRAPVFRAREIEHIGETPDFVRDGLARLTAALGTFADSPNAALQITRALLHGVAHIIQAPRVISASDFMGTTFAQHLVERMLRQPEACAHSYNVALQLHPRAARPLRVDGSRSELPLWILNESGERVHANADNVRSARANNQPLLPRASLLGVVLRTALADRFTHGLGGKIYEQVSNDWISRWLGWQPPRFDVVSATLRLPLEIKQDQAVLAQHERHAFRSAWCDPDVVAATQSGPSARRRYFLDTMAALPRRSPQRKKLFQELIAHRQSRRGELASTLTQLQGVEHAHMRARQSLDVATRRSWCISLHPPAALQDLHAQIAQHARLVVGQGSIAQ